MKNIFKQIYDLRIDDIKKYPLWVFLSEDDDNAEDECTVKAIPPNEFDFETMYIAYAKFIFADGSEHFGYISPDEYIGYSQPCIFFNNNYQMTFWSGILKPKMQEIKEFNTRINKTSKQVFPIKWFCEFVSKDIPTTGTISGFGYKTRRGKDKYIK